MNEDTNINLEGMDEIAEMFLQNQDAITSMEQMQIQQLDSIEWLMPIIAWVSVATNILSVITFLLTAWGLYLINKKLGEKHPWLSFIPLIQIWTFFIAAQKSFIKYFVYPFIAMIVGFILAVFTFGITAIVAVIYMIYCWIIVSHGISQRTQRGAWSTVWIFFVPFIMLPVIGTKLNKLSPTVSTEETPTPSPASTGEL